MQNNLLIFIPTYNEIENVPTILEEILSESIDADLLFIDDNSPDGTGALLDSLSRLNPKIYVEHRSGKLGIGSAHRYGINWAYEHGYRYLITMDCDLTHSPHYIPQFLKHRNNYDVVVGSRYLEKESLSTWNFGRKFLTKLGHFATNTFLGIPYDATGAYRLYNLQKISPKFLLKVKSDSYSFFFESLFVLTKENYSIHEISTILPARTYGHSKMRLSDALKSIKELIRLLKIRIMHMLD